MRQKRLHECMPWGDAASLGLLKCDRCGKIIKYGCCHTSTGEVICSSCMLAETGIISDRAGEKVERDPYGGGGRD